MLRILLLCLCLLASASASAQPILVDHTSVAQFDSLTPEQLEAARALSLLFRTASVGQNINDGLNCLANNSSVNCRTGFGVPSSQVPIVNQPQYARSNWFLEYRGNPGWDGKLNDFIGQVNTRASSFAVMTYKQSFVDDSRLLRFWDRSRSPSIADLEAVEASYPNMRIVYVTAAIAKTYLAHVADFNVQMRAYTAQTGKPLFDLADIEAYRPDGTSCNGLMCAEYCVEPEGGHLTNGMAQQRVAKAWWVFMAQLAGWVPDGTIVDTEPPSVSCSYVGTQLTCTVDDNVGVSSVTVTVRDAAGLSTTRTVP